MKVFEYYKKAISNYTKFDGRARRSEYWYYVLCYYILLFIGAVIDNSIGVTLPETSYGFIYLILALIHFLPSLAVGVRRMHDTDHSGWFIIVPFYNIYLVLKEGDSHTNKYGSDPKNETLDLEDNIIN